MPKLLKSGLLASLLRPGMRVFVQGSSSEPTALIDELFVAPEACAGVEFISCQIPGLNKIDFAGLHEQARFTGLFITPEVSQSFRAGKVRFMPLAYSGMYRYLESSPVDIALVQVAPTTRRGKFSLGSSAHFAPAVLKTAKNVIAEINERLPLVGQSVTIDEARFDYILPAAHALAELDLEKGSDIAERISQHVAALVRDADHIQIGIGRVPSAILRSLHSHRDLHCHGGLVTDAMIDLHEAGSLSAKSSMICTSVIGTKRIYDWVAGRGSVQVHPVSQTHDVQALAKIERFVAINSVLTVDLMGQANAETVHGRQAGGCGGLPDFVSGARLSRGGRSILALPSTAKQGKISRIVCDLDDDVVSCSRIDADHVVTEHGVADLRDKSLDERAQALIEIADPAFRTALSEGWEQRRRSGVGKG